MGGSGSKNKAGEANRDDQYQPEESQSQNESSVDPSEYSSWGPQFTEPRVPVIFVIGGPGSGKITHCDRVTEERDGLVHINMIDIIQQDMIANDSEDFSRMPADHLVEVIQEEMNKSPNASAYLISGYPRSLPDMAEYTEKLRRVDRAILLNWRMSILEKQVDIGAYQLGYKVHQMAKMELRNHSIYGLSISDYFYQLNKLDIIDGRRSPNEVFADVLDAVDAAIRRHARLGVVGHTHNPNKGNRSTIKRFFGKLASSNMRLLMWLLGLMILLGYFYRH